MKDVILSKKLRLRAAAPLLCTGLPESCAGLLADMHIHSAAKKGTVYTQALLFVKDSSDVARVPALLPVLAEDVVLWIAYPRKGNMPTDLNRDAGWEPMGAAGYAAVSNAAIDGAWSALWYKRREKIGTFLRATPMAERQCEGVDYVARTVRLPADALAALAARDPDLPGFFESMSFSHKREHAEALAGAKKPETRTRRIEKMAEMIAAYLEGRKIKRK